MKRDKQNSASNEWLTMTEIVEGYLMSTSTVRSVFKKRLAKMPPEDRGLAFQGGRGRRGASYRRDFVETALGPMPTEYLTETLRRIFGKNAKLPTVKVSGNEEDNPLAGVLASRKKANSDYNSLVREMVRNHKGLRISCISGTDFFDSHNLIVDDFEKRVEDGLDAPKVLLVYPFGSAALRRIAAEEEGSRKASQFARDARRTFDFVRGERELKLDVKWADAIPHSFLMWTEKFALVEQYDFGFKDRAGCIGRKAPLLVVKSGTEYHGTLEAGFDYVFNGNVKDTHVKTFLLREVANKYNPQGPT